MTLTVGHPGTFVYPYKSVPIHINPYIPSPVFTGCRSTSSCLPPSFFPLQLHGLSQAGAIYWASFGKAALELPLVPTPGNSQLLQKKKKPKKKKLKKFYHHPHTILAQHKDSSTPTGVWMCIFGVGFFENSPLHFSIRGEKGISASLQNGSFGK